MNNNNSNRLRQLEGIHSTLAQYAIVFPVVTQHGYDSSLYVNHTKVLVRKSHSPNDATCIELFHEGSSNQWVKSWGLTSDADWLLHVDHANVHWWYRWDSLRSHVINGIVDNTYQLRNNSQLTRRRNGSNSNVMSVWVDKFHNSTYMWNGQQDYTVFLNRIGQQSHE